MGLLSTARFHDTVVKERQLRSVNPDGLPEIAFVGRSNAGKSSCINLICGRRRLAFASRTPGRTQALNVFGIGPADAPIGFLVDTPGYGFATASQSAKLVWQALAGDYMRNRGPLVGVVLMVDIRRGFTPLDRQLVAWVPSTTPLVVVLTKSDKLGRQQRTSTQRSIEADPLVTDRIGPCAVILFSTLARRGVEVLQAAVESLVRGQGLPTAELVDPGTDDPRDTPGSAHGSVPGSVTDTAAPADATAPR